MNIRFHPHALIRLAERGATESEVEAAIEIGERFPARHGRVGFRRNFTYNKVWRGREYANKQLEVYAVEEAGEWLVITVIVKFY